MDIFDKRKLDLFRFAKDCSFGTLWWVSNTLWNRHSALKLKGARKKHPGVSIAQNWPEEQTDVVPMLFGSSKEQYVSSFIADLRTADARETHFPVLKPLCFDFEDFFGDRIAEAFPKSRLNEAEMEGLRTFLREKLK